MKFKIRSGFRRGSVMIEAMMALTILSVVGISLLKGSIDILNPRQWTMTQNITDAHLTFEKAYAERINFEEMTGPDSPWPAFPAKAESDVSLGSLPGGRTLTGKIVRTRIPDNNNLSPWGSGTLLTNPAEMEVWKLQSHLLYTVNGKDYVKSRTVVRTQ